MRFLWTYFYGIFHFIKICYHIYTLSANLVPCRCLKIDNFLGTGLFRIIPPLKESARLLEDLP